MKLQVKEARRTTLLLPLFTVSWRVQQLLVCKQKYVQDMSKKAKSALLDRQRNNSNK